MPQQTYTVSENVRIEVRNCHNRVRVIGWDDARKVSVDYAARQEGDTLYIENANKATLRVPYAATIVITDCEADVRVDDLTGHIELANIGGDVALRNLRGETIVRDVDGDLSVKGVTTLQGQGDWKGDTRLQDVGKAETQTIGGDLSVFAIREALIIDEIEGDVNLREINGRVVIQHIGNDFIASDVKASLDVPDVHGDAIVSFAQVTESKIVAKGDVILRLPENSNAEIELDAPHGDLIARHDITIIKEDDRHLHGTIGTSGVKIQAESTHGDLILQGDQPMRHKHAHRMRTDFERMGQEIAEEVRESVRASLGDLPRHLRHRVIVKRHGRHHHGDESEIFDEPMDEAPQNPAPSQEDRKAILDAIARGDLSVDDAIKKLRGE